jgi:polyhydroxybutyrate depolymerase
LQRAWEGAPYAVAAARDVDFTGYLLDYLEQNLCIDKSRIYAAGKSNGGGFVGKLACSKKLSARIAAFAPVSGAFYTNVSVPCNPARPIIPIIDFHGMADCKIPYSGGNNSHGFHFQSIPSVLRDWAARQDCKNSMNPTRVVKHKRYWKTSWSCGNGKEETIVAYNITGLKHAWPSEHPNSDSASPTIMNATVIIVKFFSAWTLSGPV